MSQSQIFSFFSNKKSASPDLDTSAALKKKIREINSTESVEKSLVPIGGCSNCKMYKVRAENAENKLKHAQAVLKKSADISFEKDIKMKQLQEQLEKYRNTEIPKVKTSLFKKFHGFFSSEDLSKIRSVRSGQKSDSKFVLLIAKAFYMDRSDISLKTVTGRSKSKNTTAVTPEKKKIIEEMMKERVLNEGDENSNGRLKKINILIKSAIANVNRVKNKNSSKDNSLIDGHVQSASNSQSQSTLTSNYNPAPSTSSCNAQSFLPARHQNSESTGYAVPELSSTYTHNQPFYPLTNYHELLVSTNYPEPNPTLTYNQKHVPPTQIQQKWTDSGYIPAQFSEPANGAMY